MRKREFDYELLKKEVMDYVKEINEINIINVVESVVL